MNGGRNYQNCQNLLTQFCHQEVMDFVELKPTRPGEPELEIDPQQVNEICATCKSFKAKKK